VTEGIKYYYKVRALHSNKEANSAVTGAIGITAKLAQPTDLQVGLNVNGKPVITWTAVSGASEYDIYRATSATGSYTKLGSTLGTSYTNTGATAGNTYYYRVVAVHSNTAANSVYSVIKAVTSK
jgi:fibronectin type 3 domain-containing protein